MLIVLLSFLLIAVYFALRELIGMRREVSWIRQFLEWHAVGFLETRKDGLTPAWQEYVEKTKQHLIREGIRDGTLTEQQVSDMTVGPKRFQSGAPVSDQATAHCNACGKLNWADVPTCHFCHAQMPASRSG